MPTLVHPDAAGVDLAQTPMPPGVLGTVATNVDLFEGDEPASKLADWFPQPGDDFYGFELVDELGRGAFARVFLARERQLANRLVVLKITLKANNEQLRLARLQHANIVPIQNAFRRGPYHVVQMPYFGRQTLADVIQHVRADTGFPEVSGEVFSTVCKASTQPNTRQHSSKSDAGVQPAAGPRPPAPVEVEATGDVGDARPLRNLLTGLSYPDAVLTLMRQLADGLVHAHHRNILHLDLKPQNVLFSDGGQPMLLDFNLAADRSSNERTRVGGTWPYMAPETIRAYARLSDAAPDERTDLYSLGVIFFELLTCRLPFAQIRRVPEDLPAAIVEREGAVPSVRDFNPTVPHAVDAIVRKLLAPNPKDRYQTVDELRDDLQRQQENRVLRHAADRHPVERLAKWRKRNPHLMGRLAGALAAALVVGGVFWFLSVKKDQAQTRATAQAAALREALAAARVDLSVPTDAPARQAGIKAMTAWMGKYRVGEVANWTAGDGLRPLDDAGRTAALTDIGEAALLLAHAEMMEARAAAGVEKDEHLSQAIRWNRLAAESYGDAVPACLWAQRADLAELSRGEDLRESIPASLPTQETDTDLFLQAVRQIGDGKLADAVKTLNALTERQPQHFAAQHLLGMAYYASGQPYLALERFKVAKPLGLTDPRPAYHCGLMLAQFGKYDKAEAEFTAALARAPKHAPSYQQRGLARLKLRKYAAAAEDFTAAIANGGSEIYLRYKRAEAYQRANDPSQAEADRAAADRLEPKTVEDFATRALQYRQTDPAKALAFYDRALELNPAYVVAWHNKAEILSELRGELELALEPYAQATRIAPGFAPGWAAQAVVQARLGNREEAHTAIQKALLLSGDPEIVYQAACVYALTSPQDADDVATALGYFRQCLRDGYRQFNHIEQDKDLEAVLSRPEFQKVFTAARNLADQ